MLPRLLISLCIVSQVASLENHFKHFLAKIYGWDIANMLDRADLGNEGPGSFGGGWHAFKDAPDNGVNPILLVHGLNNQAGSLYKVRADFVAAGFPIEALFATSYGEGEGKGPGVMNDAVSCTYVKHIRYMINGIHEYTGKKVDIVAYSMGSPISRKAILGGACVDTGEELGGPITYQIRKFLSVAGANKGSSLCTMPIVNICNIKNGLICGSEYMKDINSASGKYEGEKIYTIASDTDELIGTGNACWTKPYEIDGAEHTWKNGLIHKDVMTQTTDVQYSILRS